jgi:Na+/H+ antiporter NhaC
MQNFTVRRQKPFVGHAISVAQFLRHFLALLLFFSAERQCLDVATVIGTLWDTV